jgi:hypothetical protein
LARRLAAVDIDVRMPALARRRGPAGFVGDAVEGVQRRGEQTVAAAGVNRDLDGRLSTELGDHPIGPGARAPATSRRPASTSRE